MHMVCTQAVYATGRSGEDSRRGTGQTALLTPSSSRLPVTPALSSLCGNFQVHARALRMDVAAMSRRSQDHSEGLLAPAYKLLCTRCSASTLGPSTLGPAPAVSMSINPVVPVRFVSTFGTRNREDALWERGDDVKWSMVMVWTMNDSCSLRANVQSKSSASSSCVSNGPTQRVMSVGRTGEVPGENNVLR